MKQAESKLQHYTVDYSFPSFIERAWLRHLGFLKRAQNIKYLELGTFEGRSLLWVWTHILPQQSCTVDGVDLFYDPKTRVYFEQNTEDLKNKNVLGIFQGRTENILPTLTKNQYDLIYVDAWHSYLSVWNDAVMAWDLLKPGGHMVFDDYVWMKFSLPAAERPEKAIDDFIKMNKRHLKLIYKNFHVIIQKTDEAKLGAALLHENSEQIPNTKIKYAPIMAYCLQRSLNFLYYLKGHIL